jgi:two-component system phosphate regulon sensor histidine kinase PhoR
LAFCLICLAGFFSGYVWSPYAGIVVLIAALPALALYGAASKKLQASGSTVPANGLTETTKEAVDTSPLTTNTLLEATMSGMREGMLVVDQTMRIVAANSAARAIFNQPESSLIGKRLSDLTRNPSIHSAFTAALTQGSRPEAKVEVQGSDRQTFDLRVVPLRLDREERARGALGVFFDITRLERLERVRQEFLSNVSHELRTPLTAILAFVETLEDGAIADPDNSQRFLSIIRKNAERMHNLINDILELSAIEAGTVRVEIEPVYLHYLVNDVITALASRAAARKVSLHNETNTHSVVLADGHRLEQMLTNLIDNAIKFNHENGSVTIRHEKDERDQISVADTGDGISPEHTERIFERFYRVDRARSRDMGGTGLGLAIVKHLARAHDGEVRIISKSGEGATFIIELPAVQPDEAEHALKSG